MKARNFKIKIGIIIPNLSPSYTLILRSSATLYFGLIVSVVIFIKVA